MSDQDRIWNISLRPKNDLQVKASSASEHEGSLLFEDLNGNLTGKFGLPHVQGYSKKPIITLVVRSVLDKPSEEEPSGTLSTWVVHLPGMRKHRVDAARVEEADGYLVMSDSTGSLVGKFTLSDVLGYSIEQEPSDSDEIILDSCLGKAEED
ncbi:MAG: hypothetical protein ABSE53_12160 [Terracidiphilus sp.]|jgi:hypothetical protein